MRLRVVLGPAGSGKTRLCLEELAAAETAGERGLLIVPDQFTYAADRLLFEETPLRGTRAVRILSFSRLAHMVCRQEAVSETGRKMLLRRVVWACAPAALGPLARAVGQAGLVDALAATIRELRAIAGPATARRLSAAAGDQPRLQALATIISAYDEHLEQLGRIDPQDRHHLAAEQLPQEQLFRGVPIWVDGFASFTPAEKGFLLAFLQSAASVTVSLCCDPGDARRARRLATDHAAHGARELSDAFIAALRRTLDRPVFLPTLRSVLWLAAVAPISPEWIELPRGDAVPPRFRDRPLLATLERALFGSGEDQARPEVAPGSGGDTDSSMAEQVRFDHAPHPYEEVQRWARAIDRWTRLGESGTRIRYRDVSILVRDLESYRPLIRAVLGRYRIPYFIDERRDVTAHPLVRLLLAMLELESTGWSRPNVLAVLRNPLLDVPADTLDLLENLSLEYGIEYERWFSSRWEFYSLPQAEREEGDREDADRSAEGVAGPRRQARRRELGCLAIERDAQEQLEALERFHRGWQAGEISFTEGARLLQRFLASCLADGRDTDRDVFESGFLVEAALAVKTGWSPEESTQVGHLLEETFAQGAEYLADLSFSPQLFGRVLRDALQGATVGVTPRHLDAVVVAEPRRARINQVRRVILGGVSASSFPRIPQPDPLLTDSEREALTNQGLPVMPVAQTHLEEDPYLFYIACTRAIESLWLTVAQTGFDGSVLEPSAYLQEIGGVLEPVPRAEGAGDTLEARIAWCQHEAELPAALQAASEHLQPADRSLLRSELPIEVAGATSHPLWEQRQGALPDRLAPTTLDLLYPRGDLLTSASGLETFATCPYQFYARQVLRLEPRPEAILKPRSTGSAVHEALRRFFLTDPRRLSGEEARKRIHEVFGALREEDEFRIFQEDPASAYQWSRTGHHLELFVETELRRLQSGACEPVALELAFGLPGQPEDLPQLESFFERAPDQPLAIPEWHLLLPATTIDRPLPTAPTGDRTSPRAGGPPGHRPNADLQAEPAWRVLLRGRIDRLDRVHLPDGSPAAVVIDYKSSIDHRNVTSNLPRGLDLQIATYLLVARDLLGLAPGAGLYYSFKAKPRSAADRRSEENPHDFAFHGLPREDVVAAVDPHGAFGLRPKRGSPTGGLPSEELATRLDDARRKVAHLAAGILRGHIRPYPAPQSQMRLPCEHCDYRAMCGFVEGRDPVRGTSGDEEGGADE